MQSDIDQFSLENKFRATLQDLVAPTIRRTSEIQEIAEKLQKNDHRNSERLDSLEFNVSRLLSKLPLIEDIYKHVQELQSEKSTVDSLINLKFESLVSAIEQNKHENENLARLAQANEENIISFKNDVVVYTESLNGIKDQVIQECALVSKKLEKTRTQAKEIWDLMTSKLNKMNASIEKFNESALPKIDAEIEMIRRKIEDDKIEFKEKIETMISFEEFEKFGRSLKFEIDKTHQNFKILSENSEKVEEYLDHYLPLEMCGMVSEAISKLEPKFLGKFIDYDQKKFETLKLDFDFDYLDIDGLSKRALDAFEDAQKRRENLKVLVIAALKKEKKAVKKASKNIKVPNKPDQSKNSQSPPKPVQKTEEFVLSKAKKPSETNIITKLEPYPVKTELKNDPNLEKNSNPNLPDIEDRRNLVVNDQQDPLIDKDFDLRSPTTPVLIESNTIDMPLDEVGSRTMKNTEKTVSQGRSRKSLLEIDENPSSLYFPVPSRPGSRSPNNFAINPKLVQSDSSASEFQSPALTNYHNISPESSPSVDPAKLEHDLEIIRNAISGLEIKAKNNEENISNTNSVLNTTLDRFSNDLTSNFALMHGEIKLLLQKNKQNKTDVSKTLKNYQLDLKEREKIIERVDKQFGNVSDLVSALVEFSKIIHLILTQEEEDRENLNLIGFSDNSSKSNPKGYLSLKTECMSCSGNNTVVMSAFKMACINYNPSPIKYNLRTFSRKQLINLVGSFLSESWKVASTKPPYDLIPAPSLSNISISVESNKKKNRYTRSQYFELPSLNTSKQLLDINDSSIHSFREFKH